MTEYTHDSRDFGAEIAADQRFENDDLRVEAVAASLEENQQRAIAEAWDEAWDYQPDFVEMLELNRRARLRRESDGGASNGPLKPSPRP